MNKTYSKSNEGNKGKELSDKKEEILNPSDKKNKNKTEHTIEDLILALESRVQKIEKQLDSSFTEELNNIKKELNNIKNEILQINKDKSSSKNEINIYTDGGCTYNPGNIGSYAYLAYKENELYRCYVKVVTSKVQSITNITMEVNAFLGAMNFLNSIVTERFFNQANIYTDSMYVKQGFEKQIKIKKNAEIWNEINKSAEKLKNMQVNVSVFWVKGHHENERNLKVDEMLNSARREYLMFFESQKFVAKT